MIRIIKRLPLAVGLLLFARIMLLISLPMEGIKGYGDFEHYFNVANLPGIPFINYWSEYPPVFPFLSYLLNILAKHQEHVYYYLLAFALIIIDAGNIYFFMKILKRLNPETVGDWRVWVYLVILIGLPYSWWYLDPFVELTLIISIWALLEKKVGIAGIFIAVGALTKFFPLILLPAAWKYLDRKKAIACTSIAIGCSGLVMLALFALSPAYTIASLRAQFSKGSSETIWALVDGNLTTGIFGNLAERLDPSAANQLMHNPAIISPVFTLVVFLGIGLWQFAKRKKLDKTQALAFTGFTWSLMLLWSPVWSPQWILYLIPLLLLTLPQDTGVLMLITLAFVNLLEWPVLLGRGLIQGLWVTVLFRTLVIIFSGFLWFQEFSTENKPNKGPSGDLELPG